MLGQMTVSSGILCSVSHVNRDACFLPAGALAAEGAAITVLGVVSVVAVDGVAVPDVVTVEQLLSAVMCVRPCWVVVASSPAGGGGIGQAVSLLPGLSQAAPWESLCDS